MGEPPHNGVGPARVLAIGIGNSERGDDSAGLEVARRLRARLCEPGSTAPGIDVSEQAGETLALLDAWETATAVVLVDAVRSGAAPGTLHRIDASAGALPACLFSSASTHAIGLGEAIELARALDRLPKRTIFWGVEGHDFSAGAGRTQEVEAAIAPLVEAVLGEALRLGA